MGSSAASFPLPYMFQPKHISAGTWDARFQTLTWKIISLPLLLPLERRVGLHPCVDVLNLLTDAFDLLPQKLLQPRRAA